MDVFCDVEGVTTCIELSAGDTVGDVRRIIEAEAGYDGDLWWEGDALADDDVAVASLGVASGDVIKVVPTAMATLLAEGVKPSFDGILQQRRPGVKEKQMLECFARLPGSWYRSLLCGARANLSDLQILLPDEGSQHIDMNPTMARVIQKLALNKTFADNVIHSMGYYRLFEGHISAFFSSVDLSTPLQPSFLHTLISHKRQDILNIALNHASRFDWCATFDGTSLFNHTCPRLPNISIRMLNELPQVDPTKVDYEGYHATHWACRSGGAKQLALLRRLVERCGVGCVNVMSVTKKTPLFYACSKGNPDIVRYLISQGACCDVKVSPLQRRLVNTTLRHHEVFCELVRWVAEYTTADVQELFHLKTVERCSMEALTTLVRLSGATKALLETCDHDMRRRRLIKAHALM